MSEPQPSPSYKRLSDILKELLPEEIAGVIKHYQAALISGEVMATPLVNSEFSFTYRNTQGRQTTSQRQDEYVIINEKFNQWLTKQCAASREAIAVATGNFNLTPDEVAEDPQLILRYAKLRREYLQKKKPNEAADQSPHPAQRKGAQKQRPNDPKMTAKTPAQQGASESGVDTPASV